MLTFVDTPAWLADRHAEAQRLIGELLPTFCSLCDEQQIPAETSVRERLGDDDVAVVREGVVRSSVNGGLVRFYCDGDLILNAPNGASLTTEFTTTILSCSRERVAQAARDDHAFALRWMAAMERTAEVTDGLCALYVRPDVQPRMGIERVGAGRPIIEEGDLSQDIYVLLEGEARVEFEGKAVGTVAPNELFGEMSLLLNRPRLATVVAVTECVVQRVRGDEFGMLLASRPTLAIEMARTLALRIARLNPRAEAA